MRLQILYWAFLSPTAFAIPASQSLPYLSTSCSKTTITSTSTSCSTIASTSASSFVPQYEHNNYYNTSVSANKTCTTTKTTTEASSMTYLYGSYTSAADWEPAFTASVPTATLSPCRHWKHDGSDLTHLEPREKSKMYFAPAGDNSPSKPHQMCWLTPHFTSKTVLLDDFDGLMYTYIPGSTSIVIIFKDKSFYETAKSAWESGVTLLVTTGACSEKIGCFLKVKSFDCNAQSLTCKPNVAVIAFEEAVHYYDMEFGHYTPGRGSGQSGSGYTSGKKPGSNPSYPTMSYGTYPTKTGSSGGNPSSTADFGEDENNVCYAPPDLKYGLPTACLGQFFDEDLDDTYGYEELEDTSFRNFITQYPNLIHTGPQTESAEDAAEFDATDEAFGFEKRELNKRVVPLLVCWALSCTKALPPVTGINKPFESGPIQIFKTTINVPERKDLTKSPWGDQKLLAKFERPAPATGGVSGSIQFFCVDCGIEGSIEVTGKIGISLAQGVDYFSAKLVAKLALSLYLGLVAEVQYDDKFTGTIGELPLSPFSVGVATIGPLVRLQAELKLNIKAEGSLLVGSSLSWPNAQAEIFFIGPGTSSHSGWQPEFKPKFQAKGKLDATADFGLPIAFALGVSTPVFKRDVAIVDRPALVARAQVGASTEDGGFTEINGCRGIATNLDLKNDVYATGLAGGRYDIWTPDGISLVPNGCIDLPGDVDGLDPDTSPDQNSDDPTGSNDEDDNGNGSGNGDGDNDNNNGNANGDTKKIKRSAHLRHSRQSNNNTDNSNSLIDVTNTVPTTPDNTPFKMPPIGDRSYNLTNGYEIAILVDTSEQYQLLPCVNGNLYLFPINDTVPESQCGDMWTMTTQDQTILVSAARNIPIYYPDEMHATGVSRLRLADPDLIPQGVDQLTFKQFDVQTSPDQTEGLYYAETPRGEPYYFMVCLYTDNSYNKVFIVEDPSVAAETLRSPDLKYSITGGDVGSCYHLPLMQINGYYQDGETDWIFESDSNDNNRTNVVSDNSRKSNGSNISRRALKMPRRNLGGLY